MGPTMKRTYLLASLFSMTLLAAACGAGAGQGGPDAGGASGSAGAAGHAGTGGTSGGAGGGGTGGSAGSGGPAGSGGSGGGQPASLEDVVTSAPIIGFNAPRPDFGAVTIANDGDRIYAVESRRDIEPGPLGLGWRSRFRLAAYDDAGGAAWTFAAPTDDQISDVAVHTSGDVTIAVLHYPPERTAYDLVRLDRNGAVRGTTTLSEPQTAPAADFAATDPRPLFRMKSGLADANERGWVRLLPDGEGLVVAFLSYVEPAQPTDPFSTRMALGLEAFQWQAAAYTERWARVVEGMHGAQPAAWAYDELRQREQAIQPFLARDE